MPPPNFSDFTWGAELEFMPRPPMEAPDDDSHVSENMMRRQVACRLSLLTQGLPVAYHGENHKVHLPDSCVYCEMTTASRVREHQAVHMASGPVRDVALREGSKFEHNVFMVMDEMLSPRHELNAVRNWPGAELATPILDSGELQDGLPKFGQVLTGLRNLGMEITADVSCGLHVHLGLPSGMNLLFAKKMATLVALVEMHLLIPLRHPGREDNVAGQPIARVTPLTNSTFLGSPFNAYEEMNRHVPQFSKALKAILNEESPWTFMHFVENVWSCRSLGELATGFKIPSIIGKPGMAIVCRDDAGNLSGRRHGVVYDAGSNTTIEFRYMQMSFDKDLIQRWVEIIFQLGNIALLDAQEYKARLALICRVLEFQSEEAGQPWEAWQLLLEDVLGLQHQTEAWKEQIARYRRGEMIAFLDHQLLLQPQEGHPELPPARSNTEWIAAQAVDMLDSEVWD